MSRHFRALAFALASLSGIFFGSARAARPESPFIVDTWNIKDGLPQSSVISIVQTRDGYLWVGTLNGLARFDGMKFTVFDEANTRGLNDVRIVKLFEDSRENLWVGTESAGVVLVQKDGTVRNIDIGRGAPDGHVISICEDTNHAVWMLAGNGTLGTFQSNQWSTAGAAGCKTIIADKAGPLWLGTDRGLFAIAQAGTNAFLVQQMVPTSGLLDFLLPSRSGGYWLLAGGQIQKWKNSRLELDLGRYPWSSNPATIPMAACEDADGNLIVGTSDVGVFWFHTDGTVTHLSSELSHSGILSLCMDQEGNLWVGTDGGGLDCVKRRLFNSLPAVQGEVVQSVCPGGTGKLWIATFNGDVDCWSNGSVQKFQIHAENVPGNYSVRPVLVDETGAVRVGAVGRLGPGLFELQGGQFQAVSAPVPPSVQALHEFRGNLLVGTQRGLARRDNLGWSFFTTASGLPDDDIRAMADDAEGNLWIGTGNGLARFRDGKLNIYHKKDGLPGDDISSLLADADGALWIGTRGSGLARYFKNHWTHYTSDDGLPGDGISYLIEDGEGNLWLGSNTGLARVSKRSLADFADKRILTIPCRTYGEDDGLPTRECTQGAQPAACRTPDGTLWFPTTKGLAYVNPSVLKPNLFPSPVVIESIRVEGVEQDTNRFLAAPAEVVVPSGRERLEIHYTSLNLGEAGQSKFKYRLTPHEKGWNEVGGTREVRYSKLPPGRYDFEVLAGNEDGVWSSAPATLRVIVEPAFWQTAWFRFTAGAALVAILAGAIYYFSTLKFQRQLSVMKQQEELERERARIARDLHDQIGANLTQVALLGEMAESDKDLPDEVADHARQISQTTRETTRALDEIVWAVNPSNDTLDGLVTYACKYAQEFFELAGLRYRVDVPAQLPAADIAPEVRHNVFLAFKESVNNVVKHAKASEARIRLRLEPKCFILEIEDNGRGPAEAATKTGRSGLRNMRTRMEAIGGSFSMEPAAVAGTRVRLTAPFQNK